MTLPLAADGAALLAAGFAWRVSRPIAVAIALAAVASLVHAVTGFETLRWSSALVGLVGAAEVAIHVRYPLLVLTSAGPRRLGHFEGLLHSPRTLLGILCLASMAGDGAALLLYRGGLPWVFDAAQIIVSAAVIAVCWPRRRT